ncbi:hypothetical protein ACJIZ3_002733 [Penstemon smallii]|uniref:J domain-containing protein n=1 Tax=Penstemon smallii TaxID=265156 RepID=A0ABD3U7N2_9LAMI
MASTSFALPNHIIGRSFGSPPSTPNIRRISAGYATAQRISQNALQTASFYDVLGIQTGATCQEIKSAYRKLARTLHPDVASNGGDDDKSSAADEFMRVHAAYATLADPEKRAVYDSANYRRMRRAEVLSSSGFPAMNRRRRTWETDQCW